MTAPSLIGAGAGLIAGTAIGQDNARRAASDVERAYSEAYYACMDEADAGNPDEVQRRAVGSTVHAFLRVAIVLSC